MLTQKDKNNAFNIRLYRTAYHVTEWKIIYEKKSKDSCLVWLNKIAKILTEKKIPQLAAFGVNRLGWEANYSPQSSAEAKNAWSYAASPPYVVWLLC
jgi:hypothetical protein